MKRDIERDLLRWSQKRDRLALIVRGARQVGKSYIIEKFGKEHFDDQITINFEQYPEYKSGFTSLDPKKIVASLELLLGREIVPGKALLFLDEIQECPQAIMALRYFKEQLPQLHVIGAGSLLEFALNDSSFRMPVGRIQYLYLRPLSFGEYLDAAGHNRLREHLSSISLDSAVDEAIHLKLLGLVKEYVALGGMPAVVRSYLETGNLLDCQEIQSSILMTYRNDFGKYASTKQHETLQMIFEKAPGLIAQWVKYSKLDPDKQARTLKAAILKLSHAGLISSIFATSGSGLPLIAHINERKFKLLFLDIGLVKRSYNIDLQSLLEEDLSLVTKGALAEQFVGQELLAYRDQQLFFWVREKKGSSAEVDYLSVENGRVIPIEVKAGSIGSLKSLRLFMEEKKSRIGLRICENPLSFEKGVLTVPFYMIEQISRLLGRH
ncbi:MAG: hypothetical protein S4CHLAM81_03250 [Chlamydiales bacterium]|nr:hypothetical protein [Chlamydiales bacterium]MCH9635115.1 hypothetical protein [Chlamydiales bacterium]MCH9703831.1 AAA family ATPase [Chlamydiota bacterium]